MQSWRRFLAAFGALLLAAPAVAEVRVGLFGGVNLGSLREVPAQPTDSYRARAFPSVGALLDVDLGRRVSVRLEPMFLRKGTQLDVEPNALFTKALTLRVSISYLELPMLLRVATGGHRLRPYAVVGPTVGYLVSSRLQASELGGILQEVDGSSVFKRLDLGLGIGAGLGFSVGSASGFVEGRSSFGLWTVEKDAYESKLKTRGVLIEAGLAFMSFRRSAVATEPVPSSRSDSQRSRRGLWIGVGLGDGFARTSCARWDFNPFTSTLPCEGSSKREAGANAQLKLGATLSTKVRLGAELTAWSGVANPYGVRLGRDTTLASILGAVYLYPVSSSGYFLKGGVGVSSYAEHSSKSAPARGLGLSVGSGYDVPIGRRVSLTPAVGFVRGSIGDMHLTGGSKTVHGVKQSVIDLSLGITLH